LSRPAAYLPIFSRASPTGNALEDLDLFAVVAHDQATDEDDALVAGVGALVLIVVIVIAVIVLVVVIVVVAILILSGWARVGCARLRCVHEVPPRGPGLGRFQLREAIFISKGIESQVLRRCNTLVTIVS
jgi:hypothetical protein